MRRWRRERERCETKRWSKEERREKSPRKSEPQEKKNERNIKMSNNLLL